MGKITRRVVRALRPRQIVESLRTRDLRASRPAGLRAAVRSLFTRRRFRISRSLAAPGAKVFVMLLAASLAAPAARAAIHYQRLKSVGFEELLGYSMHAVLIEGSDEPL